MIYPVRHHSPVPRAPIQVNFSCCGVEMVISNQDGFFDDDFDRLMASSPLHGPPHHHHHHQQPGKFFSQQVSPILTRHRSLTASQVIRNRFHDRWEIRRSSVELNKELIITLTINQSSIESLREKGQRKRGMWNVKWPKGIVDGRDKRTTYCVLVFSLCVE